MLPGQCYHDVYHNGHSHAFRRENSTGSSAKKATRTAHVEKRWSDDEDRIVTDGIGKDMTYRAIAELLPGRSQHLVGGNLVRSLCQAGEIPRWMAPVVFITI